MRFGAHLIATVVTAGLLVLSGPARGEDNEPPACFDLAVVASHPRYKWLPYESEPDEVVLRSPVRITFDVEEIVGEGPRLRTIDVYTALHQRLEEKARFFLLFLNKGEDGHYVLIDRYSDIIRDDRGRYVEPVTSPLLQEDLGDDDLIPRNFNDLLEPIQYRPKDAWWLDYEYVRRTWDGYIKKDNYPWGTERNGRILAPRGLSVRTWVKALPERRCAGS